MPSWLTPNNMGLCTVALRGAMCTSAYPVGDKRRDMTIKKTVGYLSVVEDRSSILEFSEGVDNIDIFFKVFNINYIAIYFSYS